MHSDPCFPLFSLGVVCHLAFRRGWLPARNASAANLDRLRQRGLAPKRALALREFMLGHEALHRFVEREPLYRVHECVFGVLALESEPVDLRL